MTDPAPPLSDHLHALVAALVESDGLLLALDFDGTLAPIVDDPDEARIPDETQATLAALDREVRVTVAAVSGRALADLRERVTATAYAGNHGLELADGDETEVADAALTSRDALETACDELADQLADVEGAFVEHKGVTATVHYRQADERDVPAVERAVRRVAGDRDSLRVTEGKAILELRPDVDWGKGDAVDWLTETYVPDTDRWCRVYVGDDTTDEDAFRALGDEGLGIAVGEGPTNADYRVPDPDAVADVLAWLADYGVTFLDRDPQTASLPA